MARPQIYGPGSQRKTVQISEQNIKLVEHLVRGVSPTVRAPRLELVGEERAAVERIVAEALKARPDLTGYRV